MLVRWGLFTIDVCAYHSPAISKHRACVAPGSGTRRDAIRDVAPSQSGIRFQLQEGAAVVHGGLAEK